MLGREAALRILQNSWFALAHLLRNAWRKCTVWFRQSDCCKNWLWSLQGLPQLNCEDTLIKYSASNTSGYFKPLHYCCFSQGLFRVKELSKETKTPPHGVLLQTSHTLVPSLCPFFFFLPHLNGNVVVWGFACWKTFFPFLQLFWGSIWVHAVIKGSVAWTWLLMLVLSFISRVVTGESLCLCVPISLPLKEGHGHPKDSSLKAL